MTIPRKCADEPFVKVTLSEIRDDLKKEMREFSASNDTAHQEIIAMLKEWKRCSDEKHEEYDKQLNSLNAFRSRARGALWIGGAVVSVFLAVIAIFWGKK